MAELACVESVANGSVVVEDELLASKAASNVASEDCWMLELPPPWW